MIGLVCYKIIQLRLLSQAIELQMPDVPVEYHVAKLHCLAQIEWLRPRLFEERYLPSNQLAVYRPEILNAFNKDVTDYTWAGMNCREVLQHRDTTMWIRLIVEVDRFRLDNTDIQSQIYFLHRLPIQTPYNWGVNFQHAHGYLLTHLPARDASRVTVNLIVSAFAYLE